MLCVGALDAAPVAAQQRARAAARQQPPVAAERPQASGAPRGTIGGLKEPIDPATGQAKTDKNNADAAKQKRPLIGVPIVRSMKPNGPDKWAGQVYNAEDGKTYSGNIVMQGANALKLEGCALGGLICKGQTWTRAN